MLSFAPDLNEKYQEFLKTALHDTTLNDRDKALVVLTSSLITGNTEEVNDAIHIAKQSLINNEEISRVIGILLGIQSERFLQFKVKQENNLEDNTCCK